jgi:ABC-type Zn uptake system ZnuABC Zn-binding protein ZnuA
MRRFLLIAIAVFAGLSLVATDGQAAKKLRVVATIPDLKSLTEAVGGDLVEVDSLTRGIQNFHSGVSLETRTTRTPLGLTSLDSALL